MLSRTPSCLHPLSALFGLGYTPDYVCYHELISTTNMYMSCVAAVEGEWLSELGSMFFSIKESYKVTLKRCGQQRINKAEMEKEMALTKVNKGKEEEGVSGQQDAFDRSHSIHRFVVASPGNRIRNSSAMFMPKKRGKLGLWEEVNQFLAMNFSMGKHHSIIIHRLILHDVFRAFCLESQLSSRISHVRHRSKFEVPFKDLPNRSDNFPFVGWLVSISYVASAILGFSGHNPAIVSAWVTHDTVFIRLITFND